MTIKIDNGIVKFELVDNSSHEHEHQNRQQTTETLAAAEPLVRPEVLSGKTYQIANKADDRQQADIQLLLTVNEKTLPDGSSHPYEILIHSHQAEQYSWTTAVAKLSSSILQQGGELKNIADTLKVIFDPSGGFIDQNNQQHVSLLAAIGHQLEQHLAAA